MSLLIQLAMMAKLELTILVLKLQIELFDFIRNKYGKSKDTKN